VDEFGPEETTRYALAERWKKQADAMLEDLDKFFETSDPKFLGDASWKSTEIATIAQLVDE
jgi:hypothetical protein